MTTNSQSLVEIYQDSSGKIALDVNLVNDSVWLSQAQLTELFAKSKKTISEHIRNIFKEGELEENSVIRKFRTTAKDGKSYQVTHYNLDVIISVGYRVKSKEGVAFRQWANRVLKDYLISGYAINEKRLAQNGTKELENAISLMAKTLENQFLVSDLGTEVISLIVGYSKAWHLLYFVIKDHPFSDGNKRIRSFLFLLYARRQGIEFRINDNAIVALALLVAESEPAQKDLLIRLIVNLLMNSNG